MISFGETITSARRGWGVGVSMPPGTEPSPEDMIWNTWQIGLLASDSPENVPTGASPNMIDTEVDRDNCLIRSPGASELEDVGPRDPLYIFEHASLDFSAELVIIDPPYLGRQGGSSTFSFYNLGISPTTQFGWNVANIAGVLLFSNGLDSTYLREPGGVTVTDISSEIVAQTFATAFARTFAGAYNDSISGIQAVGIRWNDASGDPAAWSGTGSGSQLLISNQLVSDRIVALRPIGLDVLCVLTRHAIWLGYPTQLADAPADFRLRFPANGCVAEPTACVTPFGVVYLGDDGVYLVDPNNVRLLSQNVSSILFPIDYDNLDKYRAVYDSGGQRYILQTPTGVYIFEFSRGTIPERWFFRSILPKSLVMYTQQVRGVYWEDVPGDWASQTLSWAEMAAGEENVQPTLHYTRGTSVLKSDSEVEDYDGVAQTPFWESPQKLDKITDQTSTIGFEAEYKTSAEAMVKFQVPDSDNVYNFPTTVTLADSSGLKAKGWLPFNGTGMGVRVRLDVTSGFPSIYRVRQIVMPAGKTPTSLTVSTMATKVNIADGTTGATAEVGPASGLSEADNLVGVHDPTVGLEADDAWDGASASATLISLLKNIASRFLGSALTDRSGSIAVLDTSQVVAAANASRRYMIFQNVSDTNMWLNFGTAAVETQPSFLIPANGGSIVMETNFVSTQSINVICSAAAKAFVCKEA